MFLHWAADKQEPIYWSITGTPVFSSTIKKWGSHSLRFDSGLNAVSYDSMSSTSAGYAVEFWLYVSSTGLGGETQIFQSGSHFLNLVRYTSAVFKLRDDYHSSSIGLNTNQWHHIGLVGDNLGNPAPSLLEYVLVINGANSASNPTATRAGLGPPCIW